MTTNSPDAWRDDDVEDEAYRFRAYLLILIFKLN